MTISLDHISRIILFLIVLQVNPWYGHTFNNDIFYICIFMILLIIYFYKYSFKISKKLILLIGTFLIIFIAQWMAFGIFPTYTILGFFVRILSAYLIVVLCKNFLYSFVQTLFILSSISLIFWFIDLLVPISIIPLFFIESYANELSVMPDYLSPFYTSKTEYYLDASIQRNAGFAWEPSAFGSINIIGILFWIFTKDNFTKGQSMFILTIFLLSTLSSQSTTAYIILPFIAILFFRNKSIKTKISFSGLIKSFLFFIFILLPAIYFLSTLDFISQKITTQIQGALFDNAQNKLNSTRFGSLLFDLSYIYESPLIGNGLNEASRFRLHNLEEIPLGQGNGLTDFLADFGLIMSIFIFWLIYKGFRLYKPGDQVFCLIAIGVIVMLLLGGQLFNHIFFWCLVFLSINKQTIEYSRFRYR